MADTFEDRFKEFMTNIILIGLEYVQNMADEIYFHCLWKERNAECNVYFKINGLSVEKANFEIALSEEQKKKFQYDQLETRQQRFSDAIIENLSAAETFCNKIAHPMPSSIEINYNVETSEMKTNYLYGQSKKSVKAENLENITGKRPNYI